MYVLLLMQDWISNPWIIFHQAQLEHLRNSKAYYLREDVDEDPRPSTLFRCAGTISHFHMSANATNRLK